MPVSEFNVRIFFKTASRIFFYEGNFMEIVKIICAIILPPLGVFLQVGLGKHFWINIVLTILGYLPGIVHAVWVVAKNK